MRAIKHVLVEIARAEVTVTAHTGGIKNGCLQSRCCLIETLFIYF